MSKLLIEHLDGVARLTLNRPEQGNAIDLELARALVEAAITCDTDPLIRCVLIAGAGRTFCAGGEIGAFAAAGDKAPAYLAELAGTMHLAMQRFAAMEKPLITAVNGPAAGAGLSLAIVGDIVLAAQAAHFTAAYTAIGLTPDGGLSWWLPRLVGMRRAQEMILTNRRIAANEAAAIGLVTRLVDDDALEAYAQSEAVRLASGPVAALGASRALLLESQTSELAAQMEREAQSIARASGSAEAREGTAAFLGKRRPNFKGR